VTCFEKKGEENRSSHLARKGGKGAVLEVGRKRKRQGGTWAREAFGGTEREGLKEGKCSPVEPTKKENDKNAKRVLKEGTVKTAVGGEAPS